MASVDIVYEKFHSRHDPKWSGRLGPVEGGGLLLCVACVIEIIESDDIASVRKSFALSGVSGVLKCSPGALGELLRQDNGVCLRFIASLLGMLQTVNDPDSLEKADKVLVQLLVELHSELSHHFVLDEIHKQLHDQFSMKSFLPTFNFLGSLIEAVPDVAHRLVTQHVPMLEHLCSALLYPDEALKASGLYVWIKLFKTAGGYAAQFIPVAIRERLCILLLQTLTSANSPHLINNCVGLLWLFLQQGDAVSVLMNSHSSQSVSSESQESYTNNSPNLSQNQEQRSADHHPLPLLLKKLLLSGDQMLQTAGAKCIAAVLVHSPKQSSTSLISADIPEFLFDRLANSRSEVMLWSVYSCLMLLTEDPLFFSQCHSVYGIDSLVHSLKEALQLTNLEVPKQGLLLLTEILERQPASVHLFPTASGFISVSEAVVAGVSCSSLLVATQATHAASALFRLNHQPRPVQYGEIEGIIEAITKRLSELSFPFHGHLRSSGSLKSSGGSSQTSNSDEFLLKALASLQAGCRLAEECALDPLLKENAFIAPSKHSSNQDSLESLCQRLLCCCDCVWIPTVIKICEHVPNAQILQYFYSILTSQFTLLPSLMPAFANKLASSGFFKLALEHKGLLCSEDRNQSLNTSVCGFLQKLSICLLSQSDPAFGVCQNEVKEVENLLLYNLPSLCYHPSGWPTLLSESPGPQLCEYTGSRATQYCLLIMLHLALQQGDRLLPDHTVFSSVVRLLHSVQEQGDYAVPLSVLRSALYLLAVTQDMGPNLEGASLNCISKTLSSCQSFTPLYIHHPALLHFIWRYPELSEKFGSLVLDLWLTRPGHYTNAKQAVEMEEKKGSHEDEKQELYAETVELLALIEKYPAVIMTLLDIVCSRELPLAGRALQVLDALLRGQRGFEAELCMSLRPALLQVLQRLSMENLDLGQGNTALAVDSLPLVLKLLCATLTSDPPSSSSYSKRDGMHFKLLYHVSNVAGRLSPTNIGSLLPSLSYLYCCLGLSSAHCSERAVSMLLSNSGLMDQLQTILSSTFSRTPACPPSSLLCCSHLLLSSLITLQPLHSAQVHKRIRWNLETALQRLLVQKRNTDTLLLVSYLRLLQTLLDADLVSAVVCVSSGPGLVGPKPLGVEDGALYPLGSRGAQCLSTVISGLLLQKHELLLKASVNCLSSLLGFLQRKSPSAAKFVARQPWSQFFLNILFSSEESCILQPDILRVITLFLQYGSVNLLWDPYLLQVMEAVEKRGLKELSKEAAKALRLLLAQIQINALQPPPTEEQMQRVRSMMEALQTPAMGFRPSPRSNILHVRDVFVCLSDFTLKSG